MINLKNITTTINKFPKLSYTSYPTNQDKIKKNTQIIADIYNVLRPKPKIKANELHEILKATTDKYFQVLKKHIYVDFPDKIMTAIFTNPNLTLPNDVRYYILDKAIVPPIKHFKKTPTIDQKKIKNRSIDVQKIMMHKRKHLLKLLKDFDIKHLEKRKYNYDKKEYDNLKRLVTEFALFYYTTPEEKINSIELIYNILKEHPGGLNNIPPEGIGMSIPRLLLRSYYTNPKENDGINFPDKVISALYKNSKFSSIMMFKNKIRGGKYWGEYGFTKKYPTSFSLKHKNRFVHKLNYGLWHALLD